MEELPEKKQHDAGDDDEKAEDAEEVAAAAEAAAAVVVAEDSETKAFDIAEFSERSASNSSRSSNSNADNSDDGSSAENKEEGAKKGEGEEAAATSPRSTSGAEKNEEDEPPSLDAAEAKGNSAASRAHAQPESKRGGRRDTARTGLFPLNRWVGRRKSHHEVGDLVEAEWAGSRWWYVGYVEREVPVVAGGKQKKGFYHVVFADGDEADVEGRHLKQLGPSDHAKGSAGTLPRHVPIFDLRSGRLHRNLKEKKNVVPPFAGEGEGGEGGEGRGRGGAKYRKGRGQTKKQLNNSKRSGKSERSSSPRRGGGDDDSPSGTPEGGGSSSNRGGGGGGSMPRVAPLARRGSMGNVDDRRKQGQRAVWGHRGSPRSSSSGGDGGDVGQNGDDAGGSISNWWGTGTRYALQPRLSADKLTVTSFNPHGDGIARTANAGAGAAGAAGPGDDAEGIARLSSRPTAASTGRRGSDLRALSMLRQLQEQKLQEHQQQQQQQEEDQLQQQQQQHDGRGNGSYTAGGVMRVVQPSGGNVNFGQRVFYLP